MKNVNVLLNGPVRAMVSEILVSKDRKPYAVVELSNSASVEIRKKSGFMKGRSKVCTFMLDDVSWFEDFWPGQKKKNEMGCCVKLYNIYKEKGNGFKAKFAKSTLVTTHYTPGI